MPLWDSSTSASDHRYREIVEASPDAIAVTDMGGKFVAINARFSALFGYNSLEELQASGVSGKDLLVPEDLEAVRDTAPVLAEGGTVNGLVAQARHRDGTVFPAEFSTSLVRDERGQPQAFVTIIRDVTERKGAEAALKLSERRLREAQRIARVGHFMIDLTSGSWTSSEGLDAIVGIDAAYPRTEPGWMERFHPDYRAAMRKHLREPAIGPRPSLDEEYRITRADTGEERWVHALGQLELDERGQPLLLFGTLQDITEARRAKDERAALEEQLWQAQKMEAIGMLAGGVAHDFNNLLMPIMGNADLLLIDDELAPAQRRAIEEIIKATHLARDLVRQLMAFGRKQALQIQLLDLHQVIASFGKLLRRTIREHIAVEYELAATRSAVHADKVQLEQIVMNLAINAQDAMPLGGTLAIRTLDVTLDPCAAERRGLGPGRYVALKVEDTGIGMDDQTQAHIFEPFFTTKAQGRGTGLGLATVYGIVRQHGGAISVHSEPGRGTAFEVLLPTSEDMAARDSAPGPSQQLPRGHETVLVVEDDSLVRTTIRAMLARLGYDVLDDASARAALQLVEPRGRRIQVLLTDVVMPEMSGQELFEQLRQRLPELKVLYTSGHTGDVVAMHGALDAGTVFVQKPFTIQALATSLRKVLDG